MLLRHCEPLTPVTSRITEVLMALRHCGVAHALRPLTPHALRTPIDYTDRYAQI